MATGFPYLTFQSEAPDRGLFGVLGVSPFRRFANNTTGLAEICNPSTSRSRGGKLRPFFMDDNETFIITMFPRGSNRGKQEYADVRVRVCFERNPAHT